MTNLSKAITAARKSKFESRGLASAALNIHFRTQANYELGDRVPSIGYLAQLSNICDYPLVNLIECAILDDSTLNEDAKKAALKALNFASPPAAVNVVLDISDPNSTVNLRVNGVCCDVQGLG